jgi:hypothetical protein
MAMFIALYTKPVLWVIVVDDEDLHELMLPELCNAVCMDAFADVSLPEGRRVTIKVAVDDPAEACASCESMPFIIATTCWVVAVDSRTRNSLGQIALRMRSSRL